MTQKEKVINYMRANGSITSMDAFREYRITRLAAVIFELKKDGFNIKSEDVKFKGGDGKVSYFSKYSLEGSE